MVKLVARYLEVVRTGRLEAPALKRMVLTVRRKHKSNNVARCEGRAAPEGARRHFDALVGALATTLDVTLHDAACARRVCAARSCASSSCRCALRTRTRTCCWTTCSWTGPRPSRTRQVRARPRATVRAKACPILPLCRAVDGRTYSFDLKSGSADEAAVMAQLLIAFRSEAQIAADTAAGQQQAC